MDLSCPKTANEARVGEYGLFRLRISGSPYWLSRSRIKSIFTVYAEDDTGKLRLTFFNQSYLAGLLKKGEEHYFYGKVREYKGVLGLDNPKLYSPGERALLPVYAVSKVKQKILRAAVAQAIDALSDPDEHTGSFLSEYSLLPRIEEYRKIHLPSVADDYISALKSAAFKRFLVLRASLDLLTQAEAPALNAPPDLAEEYRSFLPYALTGAQLRSMGEILSDMSSTKPMNRLLQGDVGSGKTAVAFFAAYSAMRSGAQSVLMAPTELLSVQHYKNALPIFGERTALITSGTKKSERERIASGVASGEISFLIGTHALLYTEFAFLRLALVITDEQHRFGVAQRSKLSFMRDGAHTLIMSATPIPRTLALVIYGRAGLSVLDELPAGRKPIKTLVVPAEKRADMYSWLRERLSEGRQAYVVCPTIDGIDELELKSVGEVHAELKALFKGIATEPLHGRMKPAEKDAVMRRFRDGETRLIVSTTVIEVGVDVRNASVMIVENAERFGLAALHQLRGRVGRGETDSFCCLVTDSPSSPRLKKLASSNDGFEIARFDLEERGGGELFGLRQHGDDAGPAEDVAANAELYHAAGDALTSMPTRFPADYAVILEKASQTPKILLS